MKWRHRGDNGASTGARSSPSGTEPPKTERIDAVSAWLTAWGADAAVVFRGPSPDDGPDTITANGITFTAP